MRAAITHLRLGHRSPNVHTAYEIKSPGLEGQSLRKAIVIDQTQAKDIMGYAQVAVLPSYATRD